MSIYAHRPFVSFRADSYKIIVFQKYLLMVVVSLPLDYYW